MHPVDQALTSDPFPPSRHFDDTVDRRDANRALAASAGGLALAGLVELAVAVISGSVGLLGDALHNLSDVSTSAVVFVAAGLVVTGFIVHVGYEVTRQLLRHLMDGIDPDVLVQAERAAMVVPGVAHAHVRARWMGRSLLVEIEGFVPAGTTVEASEAIGRAVEASVASAVPESRAVLFCPRAMPAAPEGPADLAGPPVQ